MAHDDETERETVPLPDAADTDAADSAGDADTAAVPADTADAPADAEVAEVAAADIAESEIEGPETGVPTANPPTVPGSSGASGRSKGLIAAAVAGVLVIGGAIAATVGGSDKAPDQAAAPTAGLVGQQVSSSGDGDYANGAASTSPWVWQTGQSTAKYPSAAGGTPSTPGQPIPTGTGSRPDTPASNSSAGPGMPQRSSSAPGAPSGSVPPASSGGPATPPPTVPPATVSLVAGPGCPGPAGGGYSAVGSGSGSGWGGNGSGGWGGDGCNGSMQSMPMTGDSTNGANRALWSFGSGTAGFASCVVSVYVPWDGKATDTGGTAAEYQVLEGSADTTVAGFTVNQNTNHGQWVTLGTVHVAGATVKLRLLDHGIDYPAGWRYGVAAAKLACTA